MQDDEGDVAPPPAQNTPQRRYSEVEAPPAGSDGFAFSPMQGVGDSEDDRRGGMEKEWSMPGLHPNSGTIAYDDTMGPNNGTGDSPSRLDRIDYDQALLALIDGGLWRKHMNDILRENHDGRISSFPFGCCSSDLAADTPAYDDRDQVLALQQVGLLHGDKVHRRILLSIYRYLVRSPKGAADPQTRGRHWEGLGFQGDDPATDLRATGVVGLLHILYAIQQAPIFYSAMFESSQSATHEFPFVLVCFNLSAVGVECLQRQGLHSRVLKEAKEGCKHPANKALSEFVLGCMYHFYTKWLSEPRRTIADFGRMKAALTKEVLTPKGVGQMLAAAAEARMFVQRKTQSQGGNEELTFSSF